MSVSPSSWPSRSARTYRTSSGMWSQLLERTSSCPRERRSDKFVRHPPAPVKAQSKITKSSLLPNTRRILLRKACIKYRLQTKALKREDSLTQVSPERPLLGVSPTTFQAPVEKTQSQRQMSLISLQQLGDTTRRSCLTLTSTAARVETSVRGRRY